MKAQLSKKYKGIPLFVILLATGFIVVAAAAGVAWIYVNDITYAEPDPSLDVTETFDILGVTDKLSAKITVSGCGYEDEPLTYILKIQNLHSTNLLVANFTVTVENGAESYVTYHSLPVSPLPPSTTQDWTEVITPGLTGTWTISVELTASEWV